MWLKTTILTAIVGTITLARGADTPKPLAAFPGAEGFGSTTPGGRGGSVYEVTTLDDSGPGSFRDAVSQGNRTIVFRVGGTIETKSKLEIRASNITIAGQTAPGGGICFKNFTLNLYGHDLVIRHIRSRLGDETKREEDSITVWHGGHDIIIDHCSASWSVDECLSLAGHVSNVTVQWCLISEALRDSVHQKGAHAYGSLSRADGPVTWHHNLWAHNDSRNPRLGDNYGRGDHPLFDVRNNVVYDYGGTCSGLTQGIFHANYVSNYLRFGPSSRAKQAITVGEPSDLSFYITDNIFEADEAMTKDNATMFRPTADKDGKKLVTTVDKPWDVAPVTTTSAKDAYEAVLAGVGATLPKRDSVDARVIEEVKARTGKLINSQKDVGSWPDLTGGTAPVDSDHDGIPDDWERAHGLNPNDPSDAPKLTPTGYSNLEEYLNQLTPQK